MRHIERSKYNIKKAHSYKSNIIITIFLKHSNYILQVLKC